MENDDPEAIKATVQQGAKVDQNQILEELRKCELSPPEYLDIRRADNKDEHWVRIFYSDDDKEVIPVTHEKGMKSPFTGEPITVSGKMLIYVPLDSTFNELSETEIKRNKQNFERVFRDYDYALELDYYFFASDDIVEIAQIVTSLFQDVYQCGGDLEFKPETTKKSGSKSSMNQGQREEFKNFMPNWLLYAIILLLGLLVTLLIEFTN